MISTVPTVPYIFEYSDGRSIILFIQYLICSYHLSSADMDCIACCSKVNVQNPAALSSNPGKRVVACWEPSVIATIIIPSE